MGRLKPPESRARACGWGSKVGTDWWDVNNWGRNYPEGTRATEKVQRLWETSQETQKEKHPDSPVLLLPHLRLELPIASTNPEAGSKGTWEL